MFTSKGDIFGQWDVDWRYIWDELKEVPTVGPRGVQLLLKVLPLSGVLKIHWWYLSAIK